jgi:hypothetical protein
MAEKQMRTGSHFVRHSDLAAKLRREFPQSQIRVSQVQGGECTLTATGADVHTVYQRAQILACIAVLYNFEAFYNRHCSKTRWTRFATLCGQNKARTLLRFRQGSETISFCLEPVRKAITRGECTLYLRGL